MEKKGVVITFDSCRTFLLGIFVACAILGPWFYYNSTTDCSSSTTHIRGTDSKNALTSFSAATTTTTLNTLNEQIHKNLTEMSKSLSSTLEQGLAKIQKSIPLQAPVQQNQQPAQQPASVPEPKPSSTPSSGYSRCYRNPFISWATEAQFNRIEAEATQFRSTTSRLSRDLKHQPRNTWEQFIAVMPSGCEGNLHRVGPDGDGGKNICGFKQMNDTNCVIFSLGSWGDFRFEADIYKVKPGCRILTFDCTGTWPVPDEIKSRVSLHEVCYGPEDTLKKNRKFRRIESMMRENNVEQLNFLKMDVEFNEWYYFENMLNHPEESSSFPDQIAVELHWAWGMEQWYIEIERLAGLVEGLYDYGYRIVAREVNDWSNQNWEISLVRFRC